MRPRATPRLRPGRVAAAGLFAQALRPIPPGRIPLLHHSLRSGESGAPLRAYGAGRVAAAGLFAQALIADAVRG